MLNLEELLNLPPDKTVLVVHFQPYHGVGYPSPERKEVRPLKKEMIRGSQYLEGREIGDWDQDGWSSVEEFLLAVFWDEQDFKQSKKQALLESKAEANAMRSSISESLSCLGVDNIEIV